MYITNIEINNIRCFNEVKMSFEKDGNLSFWNTFLGDNGTGKTTILRCIAMGLCEKTDYAGLQQEIYGDWISEGRWSNDIGRIYIELSSDDKKIKYSIETEIEMKDKKAGIFKVKQITEPEDFPWGKIFVCGYGAARRAFGSKDYIAYYNVDAFYSLFNYDIPMQNPELVLRRLKDETNIGLDEIRDILTDILELDRGSILLSMRGIELNGKWGKFIPLGGTGDGYQATLSWILDMLGWAMLYNAEMLKAGIKGIVIIDEIEHHLHPSWQRRIVSLIKDKFPGIQFICSTHSPTVAANATKRIDDEFESKLFHLSYNENGNQVDEVEENLAELDYDQVISSEAFNYINEISSETEEALRLASELAGRGDKRTLEENARYKKVIEYLESFMFPEGKTLIEREVERKHYLDIINENDHLLKMLKGELDDKN